MRKVLCYALIDCLLPLSIFSVEWLIGEPRHAPVEVIVRVRHQPTHRRPTVVALEFVRLGGRLVGVGAAYFVPDADGKGNLALLFIVSLTPALLTVLPETKPFASIAPMYVWFEPFCHLTSRLILSADNDDPITLPVTGPLSEMYDAVPVTTSA